MTFSLTGHAHWDNLLQSISVTQVAMVSLFLSASVCVSWYRSLISMSVRPTEFNPDSSLSHSPHLYLSCFVCVCVRESVLSAQSPKFAGILMEFRLFFQVTVVCALWGVSVNSHTGREINTLTLSHTYTGFVTSQLTPCMEENTLNIWVTTSTLFEPNSVSQTSWTLLCPALRFLELY